jgi:hypothetical protein
VYLGVLEPPKSVCLIRYGLNFGQSVWVANILA